MYVIRFLSGLLRGTELFELYKEHFQRPCIEYIDLRLLSACNHDQPGKSATTIYPGNCGEQCLRELRDICGANSPGLRYRSALYPLWSFLKTMLTEG